MYRIVISSSAQRELRRLDKNVKNRITAAILGLAENPRPHNCLKVKAEENLWRIRIGDWRVGYALDDKAQIVDVVRIDHRSRFYE